MTDVITIEQAKVLAAWIMPIGNYQGKALSQIRLGHLNYLVHLKRVGGSNPRPVQIRKSVKDQIALYLQALEMFTWKELRLCNDCGTVVDCGSVRQMDTTCDMCGGKSFLAQRQFA